MNSGFHAACSVLKGLDPALRAAHSCAAIAGITNNHQKSCENFPEPAPIANYTSLQRRAAMEVMTPFSDVEDVMRSCIHIALPRSAADVKVILIVICFVMIIKRALFNDKKSQPARKEVGGPTRAQLLIEQSKRPRRVRFSPLKCTCCG